MTEKSLLITGFFCINESQLYVKLPSAVIPANDCMDAGDRAPKVGALGDAGAIAEAGIQVIKFPHYLVFLSLATISL